MTEDDDRLVKPFPRPGAEVRLAHRELYLAVEGTVQQRRELGDPALLARPWDPSTCHEAGLRRALWDWLADVVSWLNKEHTWDVADQVPTCWALHPHLVRDLAVLADQRRAAALAPTSGPLEEWHRYALPSFTARMRGAIRAHCDAGHQDWPGRGAFREGLDDGVLRATRDLFELDVRADASSGPVRDRQRSVGVIDLDTGEVID